MTFLYKCIVSSVHIYPDITLLSITPFPTFSLYFTLMPWGGMCACVHVCVCKLTICIWKKTSDIHFPEHSFSWHDLAFNSSPCKGQHFVLLYDLIKLHCVCMYSSPHWLYRTCVDGHLGSAHNFTVVNSAAVNMGVKAPLWRAHFGFLWLCTQVWHSWATW